MITISARNNNNNTENLSNRIIVENNREYKFVIISIIILKIK